MISPSSSDIDMYVECADYVFHHPLVFSFWLLFSVCLAAILFLTIFCHLSVNLGPVSSISESVFLSCARSFVPTSLLSVLAQSLFLHRATLQVTLSICLSSRLFVLFILRDGSHDDGNDDDDDDECNRTDLLTEYDREEGQDLKLLPLHQEPRGGNL